MRAPNSSFPLVRALAAPGVIETEGAGHHGQGQALADKGHEDDDEGEKQDQIAFGKRASVSGREGYRERRRERDDTANTGERQGEWPLPGRLRIVAADRREKPARQVGRGIHPDEAADDDTAQTTTAAIASSGIE